MLKLDFPKYARAPCAYASIFALRAYSREFCRVYPSREGSTRAFFLGAWGFVSFSVLAHALRSLGIGLQCAG